MLRSMIKIWRAPLAESSRSTISALGARSLVKLTVPCNSLHTTLKLQKTDDRKQMLASMPKIDEGTDGEKLIDIDTVTAKEDMFPDENTSTRLFNGVLFKEVPIVNIKVSHNNTLFSVTDYRGVVKLLHSCGIEGFKNARKGTNIAAQSAAITLSSKALEQGFKTVRVKVRGLGPGRMSAIKGLQMGGLNIISITDTTRVTWNPLRPRKARRL